MEDKIKSTKEVMLYSKRSPLCRQACRISLLLLLLILHHQTQLVTSKVRPLLVWFGCYSNTPFLSPALTWEVVKDVGGFCKTTKGKRQPWCRKGEGDGKADERGPLLGTVTCCHFSNVCPVSLWLQCLLLFFSHYSLSDSLRCGLLFMLTAGPAIHFTPGLTILLTMYDDSCSQMTALTL